MFKKIMTVAFISALFAGCSLFDSGGGRSGSWFSSDSSSSPLNINGNSIFNTNTNTNNNGNVVTNCTPKQSYDNDARKSEIHQVLVNSFIAHSSTACTYKYGRRISLSNPTPQTFALKDMNIDVTGCPNGQFCSVSLYVDKANSSALRPLFAINPFMNNSCDPKYQAYVKSIVTLSKEVINPMTIGANVALQSACTGIVIGANRKDFLCAAWQYPGNQPQVTVYPSSFSISGFDVIPSPAAALVKINFNSNTTKNLVCIDQLIKTSMWGQSPRYTNRKEDNAVFRVDLVMKQ